MRSGGEEEVQGSEIEEEAEGLMRVCAQYRSGFVLAMLAVGCAVLGGLVFTSAPALAAGTCPNEALRIELSSGELSDCRAYEMVSPSYKEGYPMYVPVSGLAVNGEKVIFYSLADLVGSQGAGESTIEGALYLDVRTPVGWRLSSLNAPLSRFVGQVPVSVEGGDGDTLWKQHTPGQSAFNRGLWLRSASGEYSFIGPLGLPVEGVEEPSNVIEQQETRVTEPVAATHDYRHVVLFATSSEDYWPFDDTQGDEGSLYEYSGTGNSEPILVGVTGPEKGGTELIRSCGTHFGSKGSSYNALSSDGERVFFTVLPCDSVLESAEVYVRLRGGRVSPGVAATVDVSASECTLGVVACGGKSGKNFEGASESGERVFFTSTQKLTNDAVDGTASGVNAAEGEGCPATVKGVDGCNLYEYHFTEPEGADPKGELRSVAGGEVLGVAGIAEDGSRVYYVSREEIPGAAANEFGDVPVADEPNLYVYDALSGKTTFIATLDEATDEAVWKKAFRQRLVEVAGGEGQFLLFGSSTPGLTGSEDTGSVEQLFEYDAETSELVRVTKGEDGYNANGNDVTTGIAPESIKTIAGTLGNGNDFISTGNRLNVSADGKTVFFEAAGRLSPRVVSAEEDCSSVYEFRWGAVPSDGSVSLVSDGRDTQPNKGASCGAQFEAMDGPGTNMLFSTADPLVPADTDGYQRDTYDAREDGGFPVAPAGTTTCEATGCEGPVSTPPTVFGPPTSATLGSSENLAPPPPSITVKASKKTTKKTTKCPKGKKLSHMKCSKTKTKTKPSKAKKAGPDRRAHR